MAFSHRIVTALSAAALMMPAPHMAAWAAEPATGFSSATSTFQFLGRIGREAKRARERERRKKEEEQRKTDMTAAEKCRAARRDNNAARGLLGDVSRAAGLSELDDIINNDFSDILADEIACQLDAEEQAAAAEASRQATEKEEVGASASWESPTRQGVSGSSTVTAVNSRPSGGKCMTVTDIAIIEGEETRVEKRMCRNEGEKSYVLAA
ncbi:MAG: hypothetical protein AAFX04_00715 [Pseudomonadota bacterium]